MENLNDIFAEEEARRLAEAKAEMAKEKAAYDALSDEEKAKLAADREAYWAKWEAALEAAGIDEDEDEDEDDEHD